MSGPNAKAVTVTTQVDDEVARALATGTHPDPFSVLGPQPCEGGFRLTVLAPGAETLVAMIDGGQEPLTPVPLHPEVFTGIVSSHSYTLKAKGHGAAWQFDDPYRFSQVLGDVDLYLLGEGAHHKLWQALGAHAITHEGVPGVHFAVWAPNARRVAVVGEFNFWDGRRHAMRRLGGSGIWEVFLPGVASGAIYKYQITGADGTALPLKADPVGFGSEHPPANGSVVRDIGAAQWRDAKWMADRQTHQNVDVPMSIYEVHLGSWKRAEDGARPLSYHELADDLVGYAADMGFTHIELMPITEHPFDGSWGYQPIGLYAPTIRHGTPDEFRAFVDAAHRKGLGVILDWVPGHFPTDVHGLGRFDGTALYEHADPREGFHPDWNTLIYNFGRREVKNYLTANALYWLEEYHLDGIRVDAVASMLYRDYSRKSDEWIPNKDGGNHNYEAIAFLQEVNTLAYGEVPGVVTVAEESTAFPGVSRPADQGGLGFGFKWNMGWMNDSLSYMKEDPIHRKYHHDKMTFSIAYAFSENFILPISHDEVVHGKGSMLTKMPGTAWEKFANLRAFYTFMWTHPGKKLLFMGQEFAQGREWDHDQSLDWHQLDDAQHRGIQSLVRDLNHLYRETPALYRNDTRPEGFGWIEGGDAENSVFVFQRRGGADDPPAVIVLNLTPVRRDGYRVGVPMGGKWAPVFCSDASIYGGTGQVGDQPLESDDIAWQGQDRSVVLTLPPLTGLVLMPA